MTAPITRPSARRRGRNDVNGADGIARAGTVHRAGPPTATTITRDKPRAAIVGTVAAAIRRVTVSMRRAAKGSAREDRSITTSSASTTSPSPPPPAITNIVVRLIRRKRGLPDLRLATVNFDVAPSTRVRGARLLRRGLRLDLTLTSANVFDAKSRRRAEQPDASVLRRVKRAILVALLERAATVAAWHSALLKLHDRERDATETRSRRRETKTSSGETTGADVRRASDPTTRPKREVLV